jgi:hypothetical protein
VQLGANRSYQVADDSGQVIIKIIEPTQALAI